MEYNEWDAYLDRNREPHVASILKSRFQERGTFTFQVKEEGVFVDKITGSIHDLGDIFSVNGFTISFALQDMEIQFVFNTDDVEENPGYFYTPYRPK